MIPDCTVIHDGTTIIRHQDYLGTIRYRDNYGNLHRIYGPAVQYTHGEESWYFKGKRHRVGGPAWSYDLQTGWYEYGKLHRIDGPAVEYADGSKEWYVNGKRHRIDGPAVEWWNGLKEWFINGIQIHNINQIISIHELNPDWTKWTEAEKMVFRFAVS